MKLRNKKTGEILESARSSAVIKDKLRIYDEINDKYYTYNSLAELNEEWEDYEEPKEYWYVSCDGRALKATTDEDDYNEKHNTGHKQIGNYFETKEEAEKVAEKLKAITRLKSCGFKFKGWRTADLGADKYYFVITAESDGAGKGDLDLLFGGEG